MVIKGLNRGFGHLPEQVSCRVPRNNHPTRVENAWLVQHKDAYPMVGLHDEDLSSVELVFYLVPTFEAHYDLVSIHLRSRRMQRCVVIKG
jgi:hypothetical protein